MVNVLPIVGAQEIFLVQVVAVGAGQARDESDRLRHHVITRCGSAMLQPSRDNACLADRSCIAPINLLV
jgi:hypothetical protein